MTSQSKNIISYFPVITNETQLIDLLSRAAWFLAFCPVEKIYVPVIANELKLVQWRVAPGMDPAIALGFENLRNKLEFIVAKSRNDLEFCMMQATIILRWKKDELPNFVSSKVLADWQKGKKIWQVDPVATRYEGSFYIEVGLHLLVDKPKLIEDNKRKFGQLAKRLGKFDRAYLMATGPSVSQYNKFNYDGALSIVCNSVILDENLMDIVQPRVLVFADPIFHFGPSQYAASFRSKLLESAQKHDYTICIPFKYYGLFISKLPDLIDRTIGIPYIMERNFNFDLSQEFMLKTTSNILTFLMIPIASTFAKNIAILGCDGRPLKENTYFWGHNPNTQINDKMANIQEIHPGFFNIDYNDYYLEHCKVLEQQLREGEKAENRYYSVGFSHIPALISRSGCPDHWVKNQPMITTVPSISIITPVFNCVSFLRRMVYSVLSQGIDDFELLLVDDGSSDGSIELARNLSNLDPRIKPLKNNRSKGVSGARNTGIELAKGRYICFLDADDCFEVGTLLARLHVFRSENNIDLVHGLARFINEKDEDLGVSIGPRKNITFNDIGGSTAHLNSIMGKVELIKKFRFNEELKNGEDWLFLASILRSGISSKYVEEGGACYRVHPNSTVLNDLLGHENNLIHVLDWLYSKVQGPNIDPKYINGISSPKKSEVLLKRNLNSFIWSILTSNLANCRRLMKDQNFVSFLKDISRDECDGPLRVSLVRYFAQPIEIIRTDISIPREIIHQTIRAINLPVISYGLYESLSNLLGLDQTDNKNHETMRSEHSLIGPFSRKELANWDETKGIEKLFSSTLTGSIMIDVGACYGSAFLPFLNKGWRIVAFEPDQENRKKLIEKLSSHQNAALVDLDTRAVSNECRSGLSFFRSKESDGISGLSAFHPSHQESQQVDTVTLSDALASQDIKSVDFLKIDTEGHDLFVLQGFPWERFKPAVIECEFEDSKTVPLGYTFHDLANYLVEKGYTVYVSEWHPIIRYGIQHDWHRLVRYPCELADSEAWGNLLAFRDPIDESELVKAVHQVLKIGQTAPAPAPKPTSKPINTSPAKVVSTPVTTPKTPFSTSQPPRRKRSASAILDRDTLIIVGNGPSLRGFDLFDLAGAATLGMNAAYRHWDRIGWYPTYYMCLDTVVTESHEKDIERLIRDSEHNGIQLFLVRKTLVNRFPHLGHDPKVIVFDDYLESKYFSGINLTTGSFAPLFGSMLGYRNIYLLGIDLNYIQQIPEAKKVNSHVLEIAQTPRNNPNYYFDDYQRKGDRYNIPDSLPDLHYQSWVQVKHRLDELGVDVLNGNPQSRIANLFDLMTVDAFLGSQSVQGNN